jgi:hypothetical protein
MVGTLAPSVCAAANEGVPGPAHADVQPVPPPAAIDVATHEEAPSRRLLAIGWNPLPFLTLGALSADLLIVPFDHHAFVLSPMVGSQTTAPFWIYDDASNPTQLPQQSFASWGGEIGYRYYGGTAGPRGLFLGSSVILAAVKATAANGTVTDYGRFGIAVDGGFSALVADRVLLALGAGLQYTATTKSIPSQQWPADVYANGGLRPRVLATIGWAF